MSEVKNSTTDIDNNVQEEPKPTPKKQRLSRADKARIESEELLKALGVTMEAGRQTRSSRRGTTTSYESPKPEPAKRKPASTPRVSKKAKIAAADQTDGTNHVEDTNKSDIQIVDAPADNFVESDKIAEAVTETPAQTVIDSEQSEQMDVDTPIESTQLEASPQPEKPPQEVIAPQAVQSETIEDSPPATQADSEFPSATIEPELTESEGVAAAADTTVIVVESGLIITEPAESDKDVSEPIELQSSPSENSPAAIITEPEAIVDLDGSSNEGDAKPNTQQELDSLDLEVINSDSSLSATDVQVEPTSDAQQEQPVSTSTADVTITEIIDDEPSNATNNNADSSVHSSEPQESVDLTNSQKSIEIPENFRTTITVENPVDETITTTSTPDALTPEPNATTA